MDIVYIETSVVSHATARPSSDPTTLALQQQAKRWLTEQRPLYDVVTSQLVIDEASLGDPDAADGDWRHWTEYRFCLLIQMSIRSPTRSFGGI